MSRSRGSDGRRRGDPRARRARLVRAALPIVGLALFLLVTVTITSAAIAAGTVGHDYLAYDGAIRRVLAGGVLYDQRPEVAGGPGLYLY